MGWELDTGRPLKEQAVERVLVRWQYTGLQWQPRINTSSTPSSSSSSAAAGSSDSDDDAATAAGSSSRAASAAAAVAPPAPGYVEMPGYHGVFVGVNESVLGKIMDMRPSAPRPSAVSIGRLFEDW